jgi:hypothetical protein
MIIELPAVPPLGRAEVSKIEIAQYTNDNDA